MERYANIIKEEKYQNVFNNYYFLNADYEDYNYNSAYKLTDNRVTNLRMSKIMNEAKEKDKDKVHLPNVISNKFNLPNIHKFKLGELNNLANEIKKIDSNRPIPMPVKLKRNSSSINTNSAYTNAYALINQNNNQNPNLLKIKSYSNIDSMIMRHQGGSLNKLTLSSSTKNLNNLKNYK